MGTPLRNRDPEKFHLITLRTQEARLWMVPSKKLNELLGGIIARYQELCHIAIYAYNFLSNHKHLLIRAPKQNLDEFEENINREISRRVNHLLKRKGKFWASRYKDQVCVDAVDDPLEALLYIVTNPTKHGLVRYSKNWPGLNCYQQLLNHSERTFNFTHYTEYNQARKSAKKEGKYVKIQDYQTTHTLKLSVLPQFRSLSRDKRSSKLKGLIMDRNLELIAEREAQGKGFMGAQAVRRQAAGAIPKEVSNSPQPSCYSKSPERIAEYCEERSYWTECYSAASWAYRLGDYKVKFPEYCYKPPLHRKPRLMPFKEVIV